MDRVWVVSHSADDTFLIVGVFDSTAADRRYVDRTVNEEHAWEARSRGAGTGARRPDSTAT